MIINENQLRLSIKILSVEKMRSDLLFRSSVIRFIKFEDTICYA